MKVPAWNVRGLGGASNKLVVKEMIMNQKAQIVILQEAKLKEVSERVVKEVWGRRQVKWVAVEAVGAVGGLLTLWDTRTVSVERSWWMSFPSQCWWKTFRTIKNGSLLQYMVLIIAREEMSFGKSWA